MTKQLSSSTCGVPSGHGWSRLPTTSLAIPPTPWIYTSCYQWIFKLKWLKSWCRFWTDDLLLSYRPWVFTNMIELSTAKLLYVLNVIYIWCLCVHCMLWFLCLLTNVNLDLSKDKSIIGLINNVNSFLELLCITKSVKYTMLSTMYATIKKKIQLTRAIYSPEDIKGKQSLSIECSISSAIAINLYITHDYIISIESLFNIQ